MGFSFLSFLWLYLHKSPLDADPNQEQDYKEQNGDADGFCGVVGQILLSYCIGIVVITLIYRVYIWISQRNEDEELPSDKWTSNPDVPRKSCKFSLWDCVSKFFSWKNKKAALFSEVPTAGYPLERRPERFFTKLSQQNVSDSHSSDTDSEDWNSGASSWKESETENIPSTDSRRQKKTGQKQRNVGDPWIREQPCFHCKAKRTRQWLSQHFFHPVSSLPGKGNPREENCCWGIST
ncbi:PREDICTED: serine-rich single-pass membrane protein 1 [Gavialis gangeticus]|uniref:serine-rich single-pass membrane protein 1 n=1 Tax=Gavialis gangeticus TaxID=94835 RepID=UPI00092F4B8D|nr:PREDICTED: serine-rich single-pass membrane protein 1 [Gavialis gangeticus]